MILREAPDGARLSSDWGIAWSEAREHAAGSPAPRSVTMRQLQRLAVETAAHAEANPATVSAADLTEYLEMREQLTQDLREYGEEEEEAPKARRKRGRRAAFGVRRSGRRVRKQKTANQPEQQPPVQGASKEAEPELEDEQDMRQSAPPLPPDFVEWEAVRIARKPSHTMLRTNKLHRSAFDRSLSPSLSGNTLPIHSRRLRIISRRRSTRCSLRT